LRGDLAVTLTLPITLPLSGSGGGGVLANSAGPLPDAWTRGVEFASEACLAAAEHVFCPDSPTEKLFGSSVVTPFAPFGIEVGVVCSTLGGIREQREREARAFEVLRTKAEYSVGYVLATGETQAAEAVGSNPSLADATSGGSAADAVEALAAIENLIGETLGGFVGYVHVTPARLVELVSGFAVYRDAGQWLTPNGNVVVASPGYIGNIDGEIVATTEVFAEVGGIELIQTVDRSDNRHLALHEAAAIAVFDPCFNVSVAIETSP
jgi:hypothetical protein